MPHGLRPLVPVGASEAGSVSIETSFKEGRKSTETNCNTQTPKASRAVHCTTFSFAIGNLKLMANPPPPQDLKTGNRAETHPLWPLVHRTVNKAQWLCSRVRAAQGIH